MKKKSIQWNVRQLAKMIHQTKIMRLDHPLQRRPGAWKKDAPSLLVDSIFKMFVPAIYVLQKDNSEYNEKDNPSAPKKLYWIIDGIQRSTYLTSFVDLVNGWTLDKNLNFTKQEDGTMIEVPVELETGEKIYLAGKKFSDLGEDAQEEILNYSLSFQIIELEDGDDEEEILKMIFSRLNGGQSVSKSHHAFIAADTETKLFVTNIVDNHKLFTETAHFSPTDVKNSLMEMSVLQNLILVNGVFWEDFSNDKIGKIVSKTKFTQEDYEKVKKAYDMLSEIEFTKPKFFSRINVVSFTNLLIHNNYNQSVLEFLVWYEQNSKTHDAYKACIKSATNSKTSIQGRTMGLQNIYEDYLKKVKQDNQKSA